MAAAAPAIAVKSCGMFASNLPNDAVIALKDDAEGPISTSNTLPIPGKSALLIVSNALEIPPSPPDNADAATDSAPCFIEFNTPPAAAEAPPAIAPTPPAATLLIRLDVSATFFPKLPPVTLDTVPDTTLPRPAGDSLPVTAPIVCNAFWPFCNVCTTPFA